MPSTARRRPMTIRQRVVDASNKTANVRIWRVIAAYVVLAGGVVLGFWRLEVLDAQQDADRREFRTAISCAFEVILAPFPEAPTDVVHEALRSGGFPVVTLEQCRDLANND